MQKIAIVIPFYKIDYFEECLISLVNQTDKRFVIYIGNDCSPSDPLPIINKYKNTLDLFYYSYPNNLGGKLLSAQWERILENVKEDWFLILGDDDKLPSDFITKCHNLLDNLPSSISVIKVRPIVINEKGTTIYDLYKDKFETGEYNSLDLAIKKIRGGLNASLGEHLFRLKKYKQIGFDPYPLAWHTDDMFVLKMSNFKNLYYVNDLFVLIRLFEGSISGSSLYNHKKYTASKRYISELSELIKVEGSFYNNVEFLRGIRQRKFGFKITYLKFIYFKFGLMGKLYFHFYSLKLLVKKLIPRNLLAKIQK